MKQFKQFRCAIIMAGVTSALSLASLSFAADAHQSSELTLSISGMDAPTGQILIALFDSQAAYDSERAYRTAKLPVTSGIVKTNFKDLPQGDYAFKLFHDADGDGELATDMLGIPSEDYYFSNDASDPFSAPEWDEAKFTLSAAHAQKDITLD